VRLVRELLDVLRNVKFEKVKKSPNPFGTFRPLDLLYIEPPRTRDVHLTSLSRSQHLSLLFSIHSSWAAEEKSR